MRRVAGCLHLEQSNLSKTFLPFSSPHHSFLFPWVSSITHLHCQPKSFPNASSFKLSSLLFPSSVSHAPNKSPAKVLNLAKLESPLSGKHIPSVWMWASVCIGVCVGVGVSVKWERVMNFGLCAFHLITVRRIKSWQKRYLILAGRSSKVNQE